MSASFAVAMTTLLAEDGPQQTGPDFGKASPFGLIVIVVLLIGVFALVWSMNRHLKRLPKSFDAEPVADDAAAAPDAPAADPGADPDLTRGNPADGSDRTPG